MCPENKYLKKENKNLSLKDRKYLSKFTAPGRGAQFRIFETFSPQLQGDH